MVAQTLLHPVSGRNTSIITRRQSQSGSSQYNSTNPYSPSGRSCRCGTVTNLVSRAPTSGNRSIKGIMGMDSVSSAACFGDRSGFRWTNPAESFNVWWMSATADRRRARQAGAAAPRHRHPLRPSREELEQQVERQQREIDKLRDRLVEQEKQIADAEKQIADLERQLALRK